MLGPNRMSRQPSTCHPNVPKHSANGLCSHCYRNAIVREAKNRPCADCGVAYPYYVMQFDHRGDKLYNVNVAARTRGINAILAEIEKCDVVCANCHAQRGHDRRVSRDAARQREESLHTDEQPSG